MVQAQLLALLVAASTASASLVEVPRGAGASRALLADDHDDHGHDDHSDHAEEREPFVQLLGNEDPLDHLMELYAESGSTEDAVTWLLESTRCAAAAAEEEDPHAGHNHRRLLDAHDHDEHDHDEHDHGEEEHADEEDYDDHDHAAHSDEEHSDDHDEHDHAAHSGVATVLDSASLVAAARSSNVTGQAAMLEMELSYIIACQADSNCVVVAEHSEDEHDDENTDRNWGLKIGLGMVFMVITIIGTFVPALFKRLNSYAGILSLFNVAAGSIFLTVGFVHLLPEVMEFEASADLGDYPVAFALVVTGFCLILFVQHVLFAGEDANCGSAFLTNRADFEEKVQYKTVGEVWKDIIGKYRAPMLMQVAILVHVVLESIAVGLASSRRNALLLFAGIAAHKIFDSMAVATRLFKRGCPLWLALVLLTPMYIIPFIAVLVGTSMSNKNPTTSLVLNALTVGCFLYVGGFEIPSEEFSHEEHVEKHLEKVRKDLEDTKVNPDDVPSLHPTCDGDCPDESTCDKTWMPSKPLKFLAFIFGVGLIFIFAEVLPKHVH